MLTVWNETTYTYEQMNYKGEVIDSFSGKINGNKRVNIYSREKLIAIIILTCALTFLCYFIYSWVSCYMREPKIRDRIELTEGKGPSERVKEYDMHPVDSSNV